MVRKQEWNLKGRESKKLKQEGKETIVKVKNIALENFHTVIVTKVAW